MNQKERRAARGLQIVAVCCCFCLLILFKLQVDIHF